MKKCPNCGEHIQDSAKKCRFCGEWLDSKEIKSPKVKENSTQTIKADMDTIRRKRKIGRILALSLLGTGAIRILVSAFFWLIGGGEGTGNMGLLGVIKTFINRVLGLLSLIGIPATVVGVIMLFNNPKKGYDIYVLEDLKGLPEEQIKFLNSFSRGGFFSPTIMLFYTRKYIWAVICLILDLAGAILGIIPRAIVGGGVRKWAYKNTSKSFEEFKASIKRMETISIIVGIILLGVVISFFVSNSSQENTISNTSNYYSNNAEWQEFNSVMGKFNAKFPINPSYSSSTTAIPDSNLEIKQISYSNEFSDVYYAVNVAFYPQESDTSDPEASLEGSLNGIITSTPGNELISSDFSNFNGYKALDYKMQNLNEALYMQGRLILVDKNLYHLLAVYSSKKNETTIDYDKFINSFELTE